MFNLKLLELHQPVHQHYTPIHIQHHLPDIPNHLKTHPFWALCWNPWNWKTLPSFKSSKKNGSQNGQHIGTRKTLRIRRFLQGACGSELGPKEITWMQIGLSSYDSQNNLPNQAPLFGTCHTKIQVSLHQHVNSYNILCPYLASGDNAKNQV